MSRPILLTTLILGFGATQARAAERSVTYAKEVAAILDRNCVDCHRPGQVAPFPLQTYEQAKKRADDLVRVTEDRQMPPWHASTTEGGPFKSARVLPAADIAALASWADAGCPEGDPAEAPAPRSFASDWPLGPPDLVLKPEAAYELAADGRDELRVFVIPSGLTEGHFISAVDFRPGNPKVVHHILAAFDTKGQARRKDEADPKPGYATFGGFDIIPSGGLGGWAPGKAPRYLPDGVGRFLPAGADVLLQVHYHKSGKPETDATAIGLYFARGPIDKLVRGGMVAPPRKTILSRPDLLIPANDANYESKGTFNIRQDSHLLAVVPHMHWLGKDFLLTATRPDGSKVTLIKVDRWDFNWQDTYEFEKAVPLPAGTRIDLLAHFDNSAGNPANPSHPPADVSWGEQTTNEMCIGFFQMTRDAEHLGNRPPGSAPEGPKKAAD